MDYKDPFYPCTQHNGLFNLAFKNFFNWNYNDNMSYKKSNLTIYNKFEKSAIKQNKIK